MIDGVCSGLLEVKELAFEAEFVFTGLGSVALLKAGPDLRCSGAFFEAGFVFVRDRLIEEGFGLDNDLKIEFGSSGLGVGRCFFWVYHRGAVMAIGRAHRSVGIVSSEPGVGSVLDRSVLDVTGSGSV